MELEHMEVTVDFQQKSPLMNFQQKSPLVDFQQKSPLMEWVGTIDILKHVTERDLSDMFNDGVLFFHLLRELFEEKIEDADDLAEKILPSENYLEKLLNWKIINDGILDKLKISKSSWFLEYLAKGNVEYIECVLNSLREIAPVVKPQAKYEPEPDIYTEPLEPSSQSSSTWWNEDTSYFNDAIYKAKRAARARNSREPSPFPRIQIARERVIWGIPRYKDEYQDQPSRQRRSRSPSPFKRPIVPPRNRDYRYFNQPYNGSRFQTTYRDRKPLFRPPPVQTYCFLGSEMRKRRNAKLQALKRRLGKRPEETVQVSDDINVRFKQLLNKYNASPFGPSRRDGNPSYNRYLYRYYEQFPRDCNYCTPLIEEEKEEGEL